jgi:hypothetical protein
MNDEHLISIGIVAKSQGASEIRLRQLHQAADMALTNTTQVITSPGINVSLLAAVGIEAKVSVATDVKNGWFVQLVEQKDKPVLMTIGRKYCMSGFDPVNSQIATKMWS